MKNLFVTDLDGTFVKNSVFVEQDDLRAYHSAKKYGDFSVATGRSVEEIKYIAEGDNIEVTDMIGFNGAVVTRQNEIIFEKHIQEKDLEDIFKYLKENKLIFDALDGKRRIGNFNHEKKDRLWNMELICVDNPFELLVGKTIYKINVRPCKEELNSHYEVMKKLFPNVEIYKSGSTRMEITARGISKASGIKLIKSGYNRIIALGDSGNDVDMFKIADISYCMSGAPKEVQQQATYVVESFAKAIEHFEENYK
ncbi:Cof-like hydrolase [Gemella bergeri ATCC 700627]|uniref:Cof-like hydrolase n=1 Tax=Gemella bergeri ATCC 700627 TaxID=1321820 RepID=U2Q758_9BACL|nr:Cof-type HAD-IIB family hydrolase [Gemella bergeri]ERK58600.1 Cof-like hydrolase [Gemella bergeri ATCC 700627]